MDSHDNKSVSVLKTQDGVTDAGENTYVSNSDQFSCSEYMTHRSANPRRQSTQRTDPIIDGTFDDDRTSSDPDSDAGGEDFLPVAYMTDGFDNNDHLRWINCTSEREVPQSQQPGIHVNGSDAHVLSIAPQHLQQPGTRAVGSTSVKLKTVRFVAEAYLLNSDDDCAVPNHNKHKFYDNGTGPCIDNRKKSRRNNRNNHNNRNNRYNHNNCNDTTVITAAETSIKLHIKIEKCDCSTQTDQCVASRRLNIGTGVHVLPVASVVAGMVRQEWSPGVSHQMERLGCEWRRGLDFSDTDTVSTTGACM